MLTKSQFRIIRAGFIIILTVWMTSACSSTQEQQMEDDLEVGSENYDDYSMTSGDNYTYEDNGEIDNFGGEGINNAVGDEYGDFGDDLANAEMGVDYGGGAEGINNAMGTDDLFTNDYQQDLNPALANNMTMPAVGQSANEIPAVIPTDNGSATPLEASPINSTLPANVAPMNGVPLVDTAATTDSVATAPAAPLGGITLAYQPGGIVKYAVGPLPILDAPQGAQVGALQQGDHPLIWEENGWARMPDGRYLDSTGLTTQGIGRPRFSGSWQ